MTRLTPRQLEILHSIVKPKKDPKTGKIIGWKGISEASRVLGKSRPTIYDALKKHPTPPKRVRGRPRYLEKIEESAILKKFEEAFRSGRSKRTLQRYIDVGKKAWMILRKNPIRWTEDDFRTLWHHPDFEDKVTGKIRFNNAVALRAWMVFLGFKDLRDSPEFTTKGLKRPKGAKRLHFIKTYEEMKAVIENIQYPDTLVMFRQGIESGARISSLLKTKYGDINFENNQINMYEPKRKTYVLREFHPKTIQFIKQYCIDFGITGNKRLYPRNAQTYNQDLKQAGKKAGLGFDLTSHTAMKHSFVSQASSHGVPLETVSEQSFTDPQTLREFYLGIDRTKIRRDLFGEGEHPEPYHKWLERLDPLYWKRYNEIKHNWLRVNGMRKAEAVKKKEKKKKRKRKKINWDAIKKIVENPKTPEKIRKYWKGILKLKKKYPDKTYAQLRRMLKS